MRKRRGWDIAIGEARRQILEAEDKVRKLRLSIDSFEDFKKRGEPWPGDDQPESDILSQVRSLFSGCRCPDCCYMSHGGQPSDERLRLGR